MNIFVDFAMTPGALAALREGTAEHQLLFPQTPAASVLAAPEADPRFCAAEIAFGQPNTKAVAEASLLRWIHVSSSGYTRYDNPQFRSLVAERRIVVSNSASVFAEACAVHALSFLVAQTRNLPAALKTRTGNGTPVWNELRQASGTLQDENVLILGFGAIGTRLAQLLRPLGANVVAYRRHARGDEIVPVVTEPGLASALAQAQHIVNVLPDSSQTRHFFDAACFAVIRPGAVFYNIGRGSTVDQTALLGALRAKRLKAAWLDVTDPEPLPDEHPLWQEPNCFITPHLAGGHTNETTSLVRHFLANLHRFVRHEPLVDRIM